MKLYMTRRRYANTFTEDLWAALSEASKKQVGSIMSGWTKQIGLLVIRVSVQPVDGEHTKRQLKLSRQRFFADGSIDPVNTMWMVPIEIATKSSPEKCIHSFVRDQNCFRQYPTRRVA